MKRWLFWIVVGIILLFLIKVGDTEIHFGIGNAAAKKSAKVIDESVQRKQQQENQEKTYSQTIVNTVAISLQGNDIMEIVDTHYTQKNSIYLKDNAQLIIKDSLFEHLAEYSHQYLLETTGSSRILIQNSEVRSSHQQVNWNIKEQSSLMLSLVKSDQSYIWHWAPGSATITAIESTFHGTIEGNSRFVIKDSTDIFVEFVYPVGAIVDDTLPKEVSSMTFPNENDQNILYSVDISNSKATGWGITVTPQSNITIRDADNMVITHNIMAPWSGVAVTLENLGDTLYSDQTWQTIDTTLHLINSRPERWSPIVSNYNTLVVKNSQLNDMAFSSDHGKLFVENSITRELRARDDVEMTFTNCTISGDVAAQNNGKITLLNCSVSGMVVAQDNGTVTLTNTTVAGQIIESGNGKVIR